TRSLHASPTRRSSDLLDEQVIQRRVEVVAGEQGQHVLPAVRSDPHDKRLVKPEAVMPEPRKAEDRGKSDDPSEDTSRVQAGKGRSEEHTSELQSHLNL